MKTIKRERQVRLDELLKHVWDNNGYTDLNPVSNEDNYVCFTPDKKLIDVSRVGANDLFKITEEVEITVDTKLNIVTITNDNESCAYTDTSIYDLLLEDSDLIDYYKVKLVYLQNADGSIGDLIWTEESGLFV